jgi:GNAT superfamily N-acetyltransferase
MRALRRDRSNAAMTDPSPAARIRRATPADAATLARLRAELFLEQGQTIDPARPFDRLCAEACADVLRRDQGRAWLAESADGAPVGSAALLLFPRLPTPAFPARSEGFLSSVYTRPEWRRRGVGRALIEAALGEARALKLGRVRLHATAGGAPLYTAFGFRPRTDEMELRLGP